MFDPFGTLNTYNTAPSDSKADYDAIRSDWLTIGDSIRDAMHQHHRQMG
ncbi:MAG: hypothetical protein SF162_08520 [bacterium]|nr:hypothetical protein [bacterium]